MLRKLVILLGFGLAGLLAGCAAYEFDVNREGSSTPVHVATSDEARLLDDPLQYRMRAAEGHLVMWIDNPTSDSIELLGNKSSVTDPDGVDHPLRGKTIAPRSSIREILPPMESPPEQATPNPPPPLNPYERSGFIPVPGVDQPDSSEADSQQSRYSWQWDDESEIRIHLTFVQDGRQFERRFTIHRVKK
ncbi:MAG: hypothetical protein ABSB74_18630 [Tepidisphaeraceae bacterium]